MKNIILFLAIICLQVPAVLCCTLAGKTLSKFDDTEYIFIGTVTGYTKPIVFDRNKANKTVEPISKTRLDSPNNQTETTTGLIVKVIETVYLPKPASEYEVFPITLWSDCSLGGMPLASLEHDFPINSEIRVIAKESVFITGSPAERIRLEELPSEPGQLVVNSDRTSKKLSLVDSQFSYKDHKYDMNRDSTSKYLLPAFETRKDLLRLKKASSQQERNSILDRLFYATEDTDLGFPELFELYAANKVEARRYYENQLKATNPDGYQFYMMYQKAVDGIVKLGYTKDVVEKAIRTASEEDVYIESPNFLQKCLEILKRQPKSPK